MAKKNGEKMERSGTPQGMRELLKKATTEMLVLFLLRQKPMYTYQMAQEIERLTDGKLTFNTMYLAVYRLQGNGYICEAEKRIEDGRARIYFAVTDEGKAYYKALCTEFEAFTGMVEKILRQDGKVYPQGEVDV